MSKHNVNQVIQRAISDAAFRRQLQRDPSSALAGFDLTKDEREAIRSGDPTRLTALGVDQRMSKAFGLGDVSEVSKTVIGDADSAGSAAFIDEGTTGGTGGLVSPDTAEGGTAALIGDPQADASAAIDVSAPTHLQTVEADLDSPDMRVVSDASTAAPTHLQTVEADLDSPDMRVVSDASAAGPTDFIDVGDGSGGDANVLDPGLVGGGTSAVDPGTAPTEGTQVDIIDQPTEY